MSKKVEGPQGVKTTTNTGYRGGTGPPRSNIN